MSNPPAEDQKVSHTENVLQHVKCDPKQTRGVRQNGPTEARRIPHPDLLAGVERAVSSSPEMCKRVDMIQNRLAKMAEKTQAAKSR